MELPLPLTRRRALAGVVLLVVLLAVAGRFLSQAGAAGGDEPLLDVPGLTAAEELPQLVVHVVGAVHEPGLFELPEGSRVADALAKAGGATAKADLERVNLASPVADGTQVVVPRKQALGAAAPAAGGSATSGPVHLNSATAEELEALPGVGPVTAQKIVAYRDENGAFRSVDELLAVPGIGPKRLEALRELAVP